MDAVQVKPCCANAYGSDAARFLLGNSFHPGGLELTRELTGLLEVTENSVVLDVASGRGTSALFLAETIGCRVVGIDLSTQNIEQATAEAATRGWGERVTFTLGDAELLPFDSESFDAVLCECAFCTFPDKRITAVEFHRVLKPGGKVGISDLTRTRAPLPELDGLLAWIACIGDAQPAEQYSQWLTQAGLCVSISEQRDHHLDEMVESIRGRLLVVDVMRGLGKLEAPGLDISQANRFARAAAAAIRAGHLGYGVIIASKPLQVSSARAHGASS